MKKFPESTGPGWSVRVGSGTEGGGDPGPSRTRTPGGYRSRSSGESPTHKDLERITVQVGSV